MKFEDLKKGVFVALYDKKTTFYGLFENIQNIEFIIYETIMNETRMPCFEQNFTFTTHT